MLWNTIALTCVTLVVLTAAGSAQTPKSKTPTQTTPANANRIADAVKQTNPNNARYKPRDLTGDGKNETMCNWYVADVARQAGLRNAIPTNDQRDPDFPGVNKPLAANGLNAHFRAEAKKANGSWREATAAEAVTAAARGDFVVASIRNDKGPGHIAVVLPSSKATDIRIAQAGRVNGSNMTVREGFGTRTPTYYVYRGN